MTATTSSVTLTTLPREIRDEIFTHLILPGCVLTSSEKPNTSNLHKGTTHAKAFVDTRIYLPCRIPSQLSSVCRQLRQECLQLHFYLINSISTPDAPPALSSEEATSRILAERLGNEGDDEAERGHDRHVRITIEASRAQRGQFGYYDPVREDLSPRFLALLPLLNKIRRLRIVVWPGYDWWNGSRPRSIRRVNGRLRLENPSTEPEPEKPDAVSFALGKILNHLPTVEELSIDVLSHAFDLSRWDLPDQKWENIQYWLDGSVVQKYSQALKKVHRRLAAVWFTNLIEAFYEQQEIRKRGARTWQVQRKGNMNTVSLQGSFLVKTYTLQIQTDS